MKKYTLYVFLTLLFLPSLGEAATYYVTKTGSNSNAGTSVSAAWLTIQKAASTMVAGDTVIVQPGTYDEQVTETTSGSSGSLITYQTNGTVVMRGFILPASYIVVNGFEITNNFGTTTTANGVYSTGSNNQILNNYIHDLRHYGVDVGDFDDSAALQFNLIKGNTIVRAANAGILIGGRNHTVESNDISHTIQHPPGGNVVGSGDADGIRIFGSGHTIRKNNIHDLLCTDAGNDDPHNDCFQSWGPAYNILIEQNTCSNKETDDAFGCEPHAGIVNIDPEFQPANNWTLRNNIFQAQFNWYFRNVDSVKFLNNTVIGQDRHDGHVQRGIQLDGSPNSLIRNNVFYNVGRHATPYALLDAASLVGTTVSHNAHYMSDGTAPAGSPNANDVWQQNPLFINIAAFNFHLQSSSPLIEAGVTLAAVTNDYDGTARPRGATYDIGAFEFLTCP